MLRGSTRIREGEGEKLRGSARVREGDGAMLRGSTRIRSGALERGSVDHDEDGDGALRRGESRRKESRAGARRGVGLLRSRASLVGVSRERVRSEGAMRLLAKRAALGGGAVRTAGTACAGTRAAETAGPRGAREAARGATAVRTPGVATVRWDGAAGAR